MPKSKTVSGYGKVWIELDVCCVTVTRTDEGVVVDFWDESVSPATVTQSTYFSDDELKAEAADV